jgi:hypothetical protein
VRRCVGLRVAQTEVAELEVILTPRNVENVLWLQIAVNDAMYGKEIDGLQHVMEDRDSKGAGRHC